MRKIELLDLPYDCLYYFVYNWCTVTVMHRKIKRINMFFYELVQYIISSSKHNPKFIKNQQLLLQRDKIFYSNELECRKQRLNMHSNLLKKLVKERFISVSELFKDKSAILNFINSQIEEKTNDKILEEERVIRLQKKLRSKLIIWLYIFVCCVMSNCIHYNHIY